MNNTSENKHWDLIIGCIPSRWSILNKSSNNPFEKNIDS